MQVMAHCTALPSLSIGPFCPANLLWILHVKISGIFFRLFLRLQGGGIRLEIGGVFLYLNGGRLSNRGSRLRYFVA
jgi:hypothetical protein